MAPTPRILVIDDDPVMRELLEALLGFAGYASEVVASGEAGLERLTLDRPHYDIVLTDLHMPGIQGHALATALLERRPPATLLLGMSGSFPSEDETQLLDNFLQKPFTPEELEEAIARAREHRKSASPRATRATPSPAQATVLDDTVFRRLAATLLPAQLQGLYDLTLSDIERRLAIMHHALDEGDPDAARREAHAIKGGCGMVGASELYHLATAAEAGNTAEAMRLADFPPACERLRRMLDERFHARPEAAEPEQDLR